MPRSRFRTLVATATAAMALAVPLAAVSSSTAASAASSSKITIKAGEYFYKISGTPAPGNVEVVFDNSGSEIHMVAAASLKAGVTLKQVKAAFQSEDDSAFGKIAKGDGNVAGMPGLNSPGVSTTNIANLPAGHYAIFCFVPSSDGTPHVMDGMIKIFDVKGSKSTLKPPTDGVVEVTITDSTITLPNGTLPKSGWIKVTNNGTAARDFTLAKYATSNTDFTSVDAEVSNFFETGKWSSGSAPVVLNGGVGGIAPKSSAYLEVTALASGKWVAVSSPNDDDSTSIHTDFTIS
ncbi:MAG: hypothetical protein ABWY77_00660 [Acidimicrobiia bacterium]